MDGATYMGLVAQQPCLICLHEVGARVLEVEVHHQRTGTGGGRRASDWRTMPLCFSHHRGAAGIHTLGTKAWVQEFGFDEVDLVRQTWMLNGVTELQVIGWELAAKAKRVAKVAQVVKRGPRAPAPKRAIAGRGFAAVKRAIAAGKKAWPKRKLESKNTLKRLDKV